MAFSKYIKSKSERIVFIQNGRKVYRKDEMKDPDLNVAGKYVANYVLSCFQPGSGGRGFANLWSIKKYPITDFVITSMYRPNENSYHGKDMAVDFYVLPLYLNLFIFNDLAKIGRNSHIFLGVPLWDEKTRKAKKASVALHIHFDNVPYSFSKQNFRNMKAFEYEQTSLTGSVAQINDDTALASMKAYDFYSLADDASRSKMKNALMDFSSGGGVPVAPSYENSSLENARDIFNDAEKFGFGKILVIAAVAYVGFKFLQAGGMNLILTKKDKDDTNLKTE